MNIIIIIVNVSSGGGRHVVVWAEQIDRGQIGGVACQLLLTLSIWLHPAHCTNTAHHCGYHSYKGAAAAAVSL